MNWRQSNQNVKIQQIMFPVVNKWGINVALVFLFHQTYDPSRKHFCDHKGKVTVAIVVRNGDKLEEEVCVLYITLSVYSVCIATTATFDINKMVLPHAEICHIFIL